MTTSDPKVEQSKQAVDALKGLLNSADDSIKLQAAQTLLHDANR